MAELALAIVPLCIGAVRLGTKMRTRLATLRGYMKAVEEYRTNFDVQVMLFTTECKRILKKSGGIEHINCSPLDDSIRSMFGASTDTLISLIKLIVQKIEAIDYSLGIYDEMNDNGKEIGAGSATNRSCNRLDIMFNGEKYTNKIGELRNLIISLRDLRENVVGGEQTSDELDGPLALPSGYRLRKQEASLFLRAVTESWSCRQTEHHHVSHEIKLVLATLEATPATHRPTECLDIFLCHKSDHGSLSSNGFCIFAKPMTSGIGAQSPDSSSGSETRDDRAPKRQKTAEGDIVPLTLPRLSRPRINMTTRSLDLGDVNDVCSHLSIPFSTNIREKHRGGTPSFGCHIDFKNRRFTFDHGHTAMAPGESGTVSNNRTISLQHIFKQDLDDALSDGRRFWLASLIVKSALRYRSTKWWPENWTPDELQFYDMKTDELADSLQSLHLSSALPPSSRRRNSDDPMTLGDYSDVFGPKGKKSAPNTYNMSRDMMQVGIRNLTLWGVVVTLLQIGLWREIPWTDHMQVRQSLAELKRFSQRYHDMTDKLINCEFGKGVNLQTWELQNEVYRSVVCELEETLADFKKAGIWE